MSGDPGEDEIPSVQQSTTQNELDAAIVAEEVQLSEDNDAPVLVKAGGDEIKVEVVPCDHTKYELEIFRLRKEVELSTKAKETTVMRYANSEREVMRKMKELENLDKQLKNYVKETDNLVRKNKLLSSERERLAIMIDSKICENQNMHKELDKTKEELSTKDFKLKWTQSKLQGEAEAHKITSAKLEKCEKELLGALGEAESMRADCRAMIAQCSPEPVPVTNPNKNYEYIPSTGELPNLADEASLYLPGTDNNSSSGNRSPASESFLREIEKLKYKHKIIIDENNGLSCKVQNLEDTRLENEQKIIRLQESNAEHLHQVASLHSDLAIADSWKTQLEKDQERILSIQAECDQFRVCNSELLADMTACRETEAELLAYTQQVTGKNVQLQSEFSAVEAKSSLLAEENYRLQKIMDKLQEEGKSFDKIISREKRAWSESRVELISSLEEKDKIIQTIQDELDEAKGEILVLKKKHETALKEMRKELEGLRRQCKEMNGDGMSSRTSSSTSLNQGEHSKSIPDCNHVSDNEVFGMPVIPDQQSLVERIVRLQRQLAKKQEKIEFLQEHGKQLLEGLQNKSKIIQAYAMNQEVGALSADIPPHHKSEFVKHGGLLPSSHGGKTMDDNMTYELSIEINRKLQAVLEDSLMKNITLKDSMRTLGSEICRLTEINKELTVKVREKPG